MAIGTDAAIEFFGTQDTVTSSESALNDATFSAGQSWTNDDDAPFAVVILDATWATAPTANSAVELYARRMNIADTTGDEETPDSNKKDSWVGTFYPNDVTSGQYLSADIRLNNVYTSQVYEFFIYNDTGQTISANWDLHVTPKTIGPHG